MTSSSVRTNSLEKKGTVTYYNLFLSNLQHNLLKSESFKFKCLKIAEEHCETFVCVWVPVWCCLSSAADLHFSDTFKVKRHVNGLYTSKSMHVDHRDLFPLAASPDQPLQRALLEIMPLSWQVGIYRASPASSRINVTQESYSQGP